MAKKKKEEPVVDNETGSLKVKEKVEKQPDGNETKGNVTKVKEKMKMKSEVLEQTITKVDLNKPEKPIEENEQPIDNKQTEEVQEKTTEETTNKEEVVEQSTEKNIEKPVLEEVTEELKKEEVATVAEQAIKESMETGKPLPENIQKLVNFIEETGGDLNDYVKLNQDYSELDNQELLSEYYKNTKPHLNTEEINFLMEDQFSFDEDTDDEREIKRKKLALKEQVANAKTHLEETKSKYYKDIKGGSKLTNEQQEALNFFKKSQEQKQQEEQAKSKFLKQTDNVFNNEFKGFEYNVGDKNYRFNINDVNKTKQTQGDIGNFIGKFLDKNNNISDAKGYHKGLFTAMNPDVVAKHFYEQGRVDALKDSVATAKNINKDPRQELSGNTDTEVIKVRA